MGAETARTRRSSWLTPLVIGTLLGCGGLSCKREATSRPAAPAQSVHIGGEARDALQVQLAPGLRSLLLHRRFADMLSSTEQLPESERGRPEVALAAAFAAVKLGQGERAVRSLEGLESKLSLLEPDIRYLRARAQLLTADALAGAEYLDQQGESRAWVWASEALDRLGQRELALAASARGLEKEGSSKNAGADARRMRLHTLRVRLLASNASDPTYLEELRWLARATASEPDAERLLEEGLAKGALTLNASERKQRLLRLVEQGDVELLDKELEAVVAKGVVRLRRAEALFLRGRVRFVSRREQREGARLLVQAAELGYGKMAQLLFDAARMLVREGDADGACRLYEQLGRAERHRAEEAYYYAARAQATLGAPKDAERRYARFLERYPKGTFADDARYERALNWLAVGKATEASDMLSRLAKERCYRDQRPMLLHLAGVALEGIGNAEQAQKSYREVVADYPLHPAGLFARTRLAATGTTAFERVPPAVKEPPSVDAATTPRTALLVTLGLDELAARALRKEEGVLGRDAKANRRAQCAVWGAVGFGSRGYAISSDLRAEVQLTTTAGADNRWAFDCRFPTPYLSVVQEFEQKSKLPPFLIYAVMRQESGFDPEIASPANARGLLQLLPATAERVAFDLGRAKNVDPSSSLDLTEPRINLELGSAYLSKLLGVFDGNLVLAVAAYNAGPKAVAQWAAKAGGQSSELFAARIPYAETRGYVERVLSNLAMYRYLAEGDRGLPSLKTQIPEKIELSKDAY